MRVDKLVNDALGHAQTPIRLSRGARRRMRPSGENDTLVTGAAWPSRKPIA